jgi:hypothetical protein
VDGQARNQLIAAVEIPYFRLVIGDGSFYLSGERGIMPAEKKLRFVHLSDIHFSHCQASFGFDPDLALREAVIADISDVHDASLGRRNRPFVARLSRQRVEKREYGIVRDLDIRFLDPAQVLTEPSATDQTLL